MVTRLLRQCLRMNRKKNVDMRGNRKGAEQAKLRQLRQAFMCSIVSLVLSCAMLTGASYAWFTEMAASGSQTIQSGNLAVQMRYRKGLDDTWRQIALEGTDGTAKLEVDDLFSGKTWKAGDAEYVCLEIRNAGSLPVAYQLMVEEASELGKAEEQEPKLGWLWSGCIQGKWFADNSYDQGTPSNAQMIELIETDGDSCPVAEGFEITGELEAADDTEVSWEDADTITLVLYMPEETEEDLLKADEDELSEKGEFTIRLHVKQLDGGVEDEDAEAEDADEKDADEETGVGPGMEAEES